MKRHEYRAECGVRKLERYVETHDFKGRRDVIETVAEYAGTWEHTETVYRYSVHWLFDHDGLGIKEYDKFPANDAAARYGRISIPQDLWRKMEGMAMTFLVTEQTRDSLSQAIYFTPHTHVDKVTVTFKKAQWSGFMLIYERKSNGTVDLCESRITQIARGEKARRGHSRIQKIACELAYDLVVRYFEGKSPELARQQALSFTPSALI